MILDSFEAVAAAAHSVCIVGAGPVALALGLALARAGREVLMLECGGIAEEPGPADLAQTDRVDPAYHAASDVTVRRSLGGTSRIWGAGCTPYDPIDFEVRPHVPMSGSPISGDEIAPYYPQACAFFGCGGPDFDLDVDAPDSPLRSGQVIRFAPEADMGRRHRSELEALPNLVICLHTTVTRLELDPGSGTVRAIEARSAGRKVRIETGAVVLACGGIEAARLLLCAQREHPALLGGTAGPLGRYYMGHLAGAIARVHFAEPGMGARFGFLRGENGAYYRRRFTLAPEVQSAHGLLNIYFVPGNFPIGDAAMRSGALSALHLALSVRHRSVHYMRHYNPGHIESRFEPGFDAVRHLGNVLRDPIGMGTGLMQILQQRLDREQRPPGFYYAPPSQIFALSYHSEQVPDPESRVTLSDRLDANGVPMARVDLRFSETDVTSVLAAHDVLDGLLRQGGWGHLSWMRDVGERAEHVRSQARDGYHQIGLTRMSDSPRDGVVDANLAVHGVGNLWIAGTGVLPTGSQAHPTFGAVARALRLAEHLYLRDRVHPAAPLAASASM